MHGDAGAGMDYAYFPAALWPGACTFIGTVLL